MNDANGKSAFEQLQTGCQGNLRTKSLQVSKRGSFLNRAPKVGCYGRMQQTTSTISFIGRKVTNRTFFVGKHQTTWSLNAAHIQIALRASMLGIDLWTVSTPYTWTR